MGLPSQTNPFSNPNQYPVAAGPMPTSESSSAARPSLAASHAGSDSCPNSIPNAKLNVNYKDQYGTKH